MTDYKPTRVTLSPEEAKRLAAEGAAMGKELRERHRRRNAIAEPDYRDAEIATLRAEVADAKNALDNTFREIDRLRDKARRFKGWAIRYADEPKHGLVTSHGEATRQMKYARLNGWACRVVRVYRRARPA